VIKIYGILLRNNITLSLFTYLFKNFITKTVVQ